MSSTKYTSKTIKEKVEMIREARLKLLPKTERAKKHGIPLSTLSGYLKNENQILQKYAAVPVGEKRKRVKNPGYPSVDAALTQWFYENVRENVVKVSLDSFILKTKALEFAKLLGEENFGASNGWLENWKNRNNIESVKLVGESASVNYESAAQWMISLDPVLKEYEPKNIFNVDETGLFFKCMPSKTYKFKEDPCSGGKNSKERVTVLVGANMDGTEKLPLLLIGKSASPHCFRHVKTKPVEYKSNKKAWMTSSIFEEWLVKIDAEFEKKIRTILLYIDNCPAHNKIPNLKNIKIIFFPPNMTSIVQPMDQGIIKNLKHYYRQKIVLKILSAIESNVAFKIDLLIASRMLKEAWTSVKSETIRICFAKAGFQISVEADVEIVYEASEEWSQIEMIPYADYLDVDVAVETFERRSDLDIVAEVLNKKARPDDDEDDSEEEQQIDKAISIPTSTEILMMIEKIKVYSESR